jgi:hypothetical protein
MWLEHAERGSDRYWVVVVSREQLSGQSGKNAVGQGAITKSSSLDDTYTMDARYIL